MAYMYLESVLFSILIGRSRACKVVPSDTGRHYIIFRGTLECASEEVHWATNVDSNVILHVSVVRQRNFNVPASVHCTVAGLVL